jgi:DNA-binding protein H-NS
MSKYIELKSQIKKLQKEAEILRKRERAETIANIKRAIDAFDLTAKDLGLVASVRRRRKSGARSTTITKRTNTNRSSRSAKRAGDKSTAMDKRSVVAPKYRDASTGTTWTGRGKQPKWLVEALKAGRKMEDFKI